MGLHAAPVIPEDCLYINTWPFYQSRAVSLGMQLYWLYPLYARRPSSLLKA